MSVPGRTRSARRRLGALVLALLAAALIALPAGGATAGETATASQAKRVDIKGFAFKPKTLRVGAGARVTFKNNDRARHNATRRGSFRTGNLRKGQSKTIRFKKRGTFRYHCTIHPFMRGKIFVK
jgi:plastocyanin